MVSKEEQESSLTPVQAQAFHRSDGGGCSWEREDARPRRKEKNARKGSRSEGLKTDKAASTEKRTTKKKKNNKNQIGRTADTNASNILRRQSVKAKKTTSADQDQERKDSQRNIGRGRTTAVSENCSRRDSSRSCSPSNPGSRSPSRRFMYILSCIDKASGLVFQPKRKQTEDSMSYSLIGDQEADHRGNNKRQSCCSTKSSSRSFTVRTTLSSLDEDVESNSRYARSRPMSPDELVTNNTDMRCKSEQPSLSGQASPKDLSGTTVHLNGQLSSSVRHQLYEPRPPPVDVLSTKSLSATPHDSPRRRSRDALYRTTSSPTIVRRRRNSSSASKTGSTGASHHSRDGVTESSAGEVVKELDHLSPASPSIDFMKKLSASSFYSPHGTSRMSTLSLSSSSVMSMTSPSMLTSVVPPATAPRAYSFSSVIDSATAIASTSILSSPQPTLTTVSPTQASPQSKSSLASSFLTSPTLQQPAVDVRNSHRSITSVPEATSKCEKVEHCFSTAALNDSLELIPEAAYHSLVSPSRQKLPSSPNITSLMEAGGASTSQEGMEDIKNAKESSKKDPQTEIAKGDLTSKNPSQETAEYPLNKRRSSHPSLDTMPSTSSDRPPRSPRRSLSNEPRQRRDTDACDASSSSHTSNRSQGVSINKDCFDVAYDPFVDYDSDDSISSVEDQSPTIIATPRSLHSGDHDPFYEEDEIVIPLAPPASGNTKKDVPAVRPTRSPSKEGSFSSRGNSLNKNRRIPGRQDLISALHHYSVLSPDGRFSKDKSKLSQSPPAAHVASEPPRPPQRKKSNDELVSPNSSKSVGKIPTVIIPSKVTTPVSPLPTHSRHLPATRWVDDVPLWLDDTPTVDPTGDIGQQHHQNLQYHHKTTTNSIPHINTSGLDRWGEHNLPTPNASPKCRVQEKHDAAKMTLSPPDDRWK